MQPKERTILVLIKNTLYEISIENCLSLEDSPGNLAAVSEPDVELWIDESGATKGWDGLIEHTKELNEG